MLLRREKDESPKGRSWVVLVSSTSSFMHLSAAPRPHSFLASWQGDWLMSLGEQPSRRSGHDGL